MPSGTPRGILVVSSRGGRPSLVPITNGLLSSSGGERLLWSVGRSPQLCLARIVKASPCPSSYLLYSVCWRNPPTYPKRGQVPPEYPSLARGARVSRKVPLANETAYAVLRYAEYFSGFTHRQALVFVRCGVHSASVAFLDALCVLRPTARGSSLRSTANTSSIISAANLLALPVGML